MNEIDPEVVDTSSDEETEETVPESDTEETTDEKPTEPSSEDLENENARLKRELARARKKIDQPQEDAPPAKKGLDDTQLDYLDLKGITEQEDVDLIQSVMEKTGKSLRDTLKDPYVASSLDAAKKERAVLAATPSGTKRPGQSVIDDVDFWYSKYSQKWELPANLPKGMAAKLVDRRYEAENPNTEPF